MFRGKAASLPPPHTKTDRVYDELVERSKTILWIDVISLIVQQVFFVLGLLLQ